MRDLSEEERQQNRKMDVESVAKVVFRNLKKNPETYLDGSDFSCYVEELGSPLFSKVNDRLSHSDHAEVLEAVTLLERRGLVVRNVPERGRGGNRDQFIVYLTSIGINSDVDGVGRLLVDKPEEIVSELEERVGVLDPVVRQYYLESIRACQAGLDILSVLGLGVASERAIHWLAESIGSYSENYQKQIDEKRNISELTQYLSRVIFNVFDNEKGFAKELKELLDELGQLYRKNRNDVGHPEAVEQTSWLGQGQAGRLDLFRRYIVTICDAIKRLENNQPPDS